MSQRPQSEVRAEFIEKVGQIMQGDGLSRISGRVFGLFLFDGEVRSFGEIVEELNVSRASVSTATRFLEDRGVLKRVGRAGQRQDYFQLTENPFEGLLEHVSAAMKRAKLEIEESVGDVASQNTGTCERLTQFVRFYDTLISTFAQTTKDFCQSRKGE